MSRFTSLPLSLEGLRLIELKEIGDTRGSLTRMFCADELAAAGWAKPIAQVNFTRTAKRGTVRGIHYQNSPYSEMKLVSCIRGAVWDVVIDLRVNSPTFLMWHAENLSLANARALLIPEGFAHGFQALTDDVEMLYCHSNFYNHEAEAGLNPTDITLSIPWPIDITELSMRDASHPLISPAYKGVRL